MGTQGRANGGRRVFSSRHLSGSLAVCLGLLSASLGIWPGGVDAASAFQITEFPIPTEISRPSGIAAGPDGNVWFTEEWTAAHKIGRITPEGQITEFPLASTANLNSITAGSDGNMWFTEGTSTVGRITPKGSIAEFEVPGFGDRQTDGITAGPDGNLWFREVYPNAIGRVTPKGQFAEFPLPEGSGFPIQLATGPDGNVWFTEYEPDRIGRITPEGQITEFPLSSGSTPYGITTGPDGNLWFPERGADRIGRITPEGQITEFPLLSTGEGPEEITTGPDGNLWFTEAGIDRLGRITMSGQVAEYAIPTSNSVPYDITLGPDGNLWFAEWLAGQIGRLTLGANVPLTVTKVGSGAGTVFSEPKGIDCGKACSAEFEEGTEVALFAEPTPGSTFSGWSGAGCSGTEKVCKVTMDTAKEVVATFDSIPQLKLTVAKAGTGSGTVFSEPEGIDCGKICEAALTEGTEVALFAEPAPGSKFVGWEGCDGAGGATCKVLLSEEKTVTAQFDLKAPGETLTVTKVGSGAGTVFSEPKGIDCGKACSAEFEEGTEVALFAEPTPGSTFSGWSGAGCSGTEKVCKVTMDTAKEVVATFDSIPQLKLTVAKAGTGSGTVFSEPEGIDCGKACSAEYEEGEGLALFAEPAPGSKFVGWEGCDGAGGATCKVLLSEEKTVTAQFDLKAPGETLTVAIEGSGSGTVVSEPSGIKCSETCSAEFEEGTEVALFAEPTPGSTFSGWSGAGCSGTGACKITMDEAKEVTATFDPIPKLKLSVIKVGSGSGTVSSSPKGINCGASCTAEFEEGKTILLTASPSKGSKFIGWEGCDAGGVSGAFCKVTLSKEKTVTAQFNLNVSSKTLTVTKVGTGSGTVTSSPKGIIDCGKICEAALTEGTEVALFAEPAAGSKFAGWSGGGCSGTGVCKITMSVAKEVTATFDLVPQRKLTVAIEGTGAGTVFSEPSGIDCGKACSAEFEEGTEVALFAEPTPGSTFSGWSGAGCSGTEKACKVTMDAAKAVVATFDSIPQLKLTVTKVGSGSGTVFSEPEGIDCGKACSADYEVDTAVTLQASPASGSNFTSWQGCDFVNGGECKVTMSAARAVKVKFTEVKALSVVKEGSGTGSIKSAPSGVNCLAACTSAVAEFATGKAIVVTATPYKGSTFVEWGGDCAGSGPCAVTMSAAKSVTATFAPIAKRALTVDKFGPGTGTVKSKPATINCGSACSTQTSVFYEGTKAALTPTPARGMAFTEWSGACTGSGSCEVTMSEAKTVGVVFSVITPPKSMTTFALTVAKAAGTGTGKVTSYSGGVNCDANCLTTTTAVRSAVKVILTPTPAVGSTFTGWTGACTGSGPCEVTMSEAKEVEAEFSAIAVKTLTVEKVGGGMGTVKSEPVGINCGLNCASTVASYSETAAVTLTGTPGMGSGAVQWSGCDKVGDKDKCIVFTSSNKTVTAKFE